MIQPLHSKSGSKCRRGGENHEVSCGRRACLYSSVQICSLTLSSPDERTRWLTTFWSTETRSHLGAPPPEVWALSSNWRRPCIVPRQLSMLGRIRYDRRSCQHYSNCWVEVVAWECEAGRYGILATSPAISAHCPGCLSTSRHGLGWGILDEPRSASGCNPESCEKWLWLLKVFLITFPATLDLNCTISEEVFMNDYTDLFGQSEESRLSRRDVLTSPDFRLCLQALRTINSEALKAILTDMTHISPAINLYQRQRQYQQIEKSDR
jgi:hypothetical protein